LNWREHIACDRETLGGKPTVRGTRVSAAMLLERLADGWSIEDLRASYPRVTEADIRAVFALASELTEQFRDRDSGQ
jgi:uncharacterized protein (DUF433 family)